MSPVRSPASPSIPLMPAVVAWAALTSFGVAAASLVLGSGPQTPMKLCLALAVRWGCTFVVLLAVSRMVGTGVFSRDFGVAFRPIDLGGLVVGGALQFALPVLYVPLRWLWPAIFGGESVERRARDLFDGVDGAALVVLVVCVVVGAPVVEELLYRGLLQRSATQVFGRWGALVAVSIMFAVIHLSPPEIPGLVFAGLAFGAWVVFTGRLGGAVCTHVGFNAVGVGMVVFS